MSRDDWQAMPVSEAVVLNPAIVMERGVEYPFVEMAAIDPSHPQVGPSELREFRGSGSRFKSGDTLFARITPCLENGKVARFYSNGTESRAHGSTEFIVFRGRKGVTSDDFAFYLARSPDLREYAIAKMTGSSGRQRVPIDAFNHLIVTIPPPGEQRAITAVLGTLDEKIGQNRQTSRSLEALARATFKAWFVDFEPVKAKAAGATSFPGMPAAVFAALPNGLDESSAGLKPKGWNIVSVYDLANVVYGAPFASKLFNSESDGTPLIRIRDLQTHSPGISTTERHPKGRLIHPGEIVVGMDGEFRLHYWTGPVAWLNQRLCSFQPKPSVPIMYLGEVLRAPLNYVERSETATTVIHLGKYDIDRFEVLRPDQASLAAFGDITSPILELLVQLAAESTKLAALRDYLLPRLLSGQVRVVSSHEK